MIINSRQRERCFGRVGECSGVRIPAATRRYAAEPWPEAAGDRSTMKRITMGRVSGERAVTLGRPCERQLPLHAIAQYR